ncbi:MAG: NAD(P)/FAD-dependent oxidoreductase [Firmicutes bacterium]|nr:NAD(P)/FAD-dependent oxidoreductase [Bacillota bacterium]
MYDVAIIGAGIIGSFISRELSKYDLKTVLIEKDNDVSNGTTKANSAIIHAGYDAFYKTNKGKFNALGNPMFDKVCKELDVAFKRIGSYVLAYSEKEIETLKRLLENGEKLGIPDIKIIDGDEIRKREPKLSDEIVAGLYAKTAGIVGPFELCIALCENAVENGTKLLLNYEVSNIEKNENRFIISSNEKSIEAKYVINCAGVYADKINNMVNKPKFKITPRRGEYYLLDKRTNGLVNSIIFNCPTKMGKGVLVTPTVHGNILIGPNSEDISSKEENKTTFSGLEFVKESASKSVKNIPFNEVITTFSGLRAEATGGDFIIEKSDTKGFINVAGIKSPGLSASPAIAKYIVKIIKDLNEGLKENKDFNPIRKKIVKFSELKDEEKKELIKKDKRYGRIICRCENITEGEIVDVINRLVGARTVDGVKRRARPGMGRCQGGFCSPRVVEILARELGKRVEDIVKSNKESYIITKETKGNIDYNK